MTPNTLPPLIARPAAVSGDQLARRGGWWLGVSTLIALMLGIQAYQAVTFDINTDEFLFLSKIYAYEQGRLSQILQTFHVHLFWWVPQLYDNAIDQLVAARLLMVGLIALTLLLLYRIYTLFLDPLAAGVALLGYASFRYVLEYAGSFRADPIATGLLVAAGYLIACRKGYGTLSAAGALVALATLVTIKSVFYFLPLGALLGYKLYRAHTTGCARRGWLEALACVAAAWVALGVLLWAHVASLDSGQAGPVSGLSGTLTGVFQTALVDHELLTTSLSLIVISATESALFWSTFALGLGVAVSGVVRHRGNVRVRNAVMLGLALPILTLFLYRNTFPYYYVFLLPFPAAVCGLTVERLPWAKAPRRAQGLLGALLGIAVLGAMGTVVTNLPRTQAGQRAVLEGVHTIFPDPVSYIDFTAMVPSYPKHGFFMSTWGFRTYHAKAEPMMPGLLRRHAPKFVLANHPALALRTTGAGPPDRLKPRDLATLRRNYVHHWGPVYVAGKRVPLDTPTAARAIDVTIPGPYTVEAGAAVTIDGTRREPGELVTLARGRVTVAADGRATPVTLRWGRDLPRPDRPPPDAPMFFGLVVR